MNKFFSDNISVVILIVAGLAIAAFVISIINRGAILGLPKPETTGGTTGGTDDGTGEDK